MIVIKLLVLTSGNSPAPAGRTSYEIPRSGSSSSIWLPLRPVTIQEDKGESPWSTYNLWRGPNINHTFSTLFCICFLWYQQGSSFESLNALEQFSSECHKTKTKVITLANQKDGGNPVIQSKLDVPVASQLLQGLTWLETTLTLNKRTNNRNNGP